MDTETTEGNWDQVFEKPIAVLSFFFLERKSFQKDCRLIFLNLYFKEWDFLKSQK
jgi:hypothetical protein